MINLNKTNINIISLIITITIFLAIVLSIQKISEGKLHTKLNEISITQNEQNKIESQENSINQEIVEENKNIDKSITQSNDAPQEWNIEIKSINISGPIKEMEEMKVPEDAVGHFKNTEIEKNNIALIAYNSGKPKNYFANLKELKAGEEIIYSVNNTKRRYKVLSNKVIEKRELENAIKETPQDQANYLKLFTYVIDLKDKMRYVQAREVKK